MEAELEFSSETSPSITSKMERLLQVKRRADIEVRKEKKKQAELRRKQDAQRKILLGAAVLKSRDNQLLNRLVMLLEPADRGKFRALSEQLGDIRADPKGEL